MTDVIIIAVLAVIIVMAARYLYQAKKNGAACVGCPAGGCSACRTQDPAESGSCGCSCGGCPGSK